MGARGRGTAYEIHLESNSPHHSGLLSGQKAGGRSYYLDDNGELSKVSTPRRVKLDWFTGQNEDGSGERLDNRAKRKLPTPQRSTMALLIKKVRMGQQGAKKRKRLKKENIKGKSKMQRLISDWITSRKEKKNAESDIYFEMILLVFLTASQPLPYRGLSRDLHVPRKSHTSTKSGRRRG